MNDGRIRAVLGHDRVLESDLRALRRMYRPRAQGQPSVVRLWGRCRVLHPSGCWEWTGHVNPDGYGKVSVAGRQIGAHRLAWMLTRGRIEPGLIVCHACDRPACINPDHLFLGTHRDNAHDRDRKGRRSNGRRERPHCSQGHPFSEENTYRYGNHRVCRACNREFQRRRKQRAS